MSAKLYHKLVRDRIPEIIEADGKTCICETLSHEDYLRLLDEKLNEELAEYQASKSLEELADLLEVMQAVVKARGWTEEELEQVRADKVAKRGGFEKKILLKEVLTITVWTLWQEIRMMANTMKSKSRPSVIWTMFISEKIKWRCLQLDWYIYCYFQTALCQIVT